MNEVRLGFFSFTEVTDPTQHRAYNEWHQLDHMPEQHPLRGVALGNRWVSTPACREARRASGPLLDPAHYVTVYLVTEPVQETLREFVELAETLREKGRWFDARRSHLSGPFRLVDTAASERVRVSAEALPWRPHRGLWVTVDDSASVRERAVVSRSLELPGVAGVWSFRSRERRISVWYLDEAPLEVGPALGETLGDPPATLLSGPFETIAPWEWGWFDE